MASLDAGGVPFGVPSAAAAEFLFPWISISGLRKMHGSRDFLPISLDPASKEETVTQSLRMYVWSYVRRLGTAAFEDQGIYESSSISYGLYWWTGI